MALSEKQRQKRLTKKSANRKAKQAERRSSGTAGSSTYSSHFPISNCLVSIDLFDNGMGNAILTRSLSNGNIAFAVFLIDTFCLGVKNAIYREIHYTEFEFYRKQLETNSPLEKIEPSCLRKLVEDAVLYAQDIGFSPHPDYAKAFRLFGDINASTCPIQYTFGKDGKPCYVNGPHETLAQQHKIINTLTRNLGTDGFTYLLMMGDMDNKNNRKSVSTINQPSRNLVLNYEISDEPPEDSLFLKLPESVRDEFNEIYQALFKNPWQAREMILPMIQRYPDVPQLYNYLYIAYNLTKDTDNAQRILQETLNRFPDYLFARVSKANEYLQRNESDQIPVIFDGKFDISLVFPNRKSFHRSEVLNFSGIMAQYFYAKGKKDTAEIYYTFMKKIGPDHRVTKEVNKIIHPLFDRIKGWFKNFWSRK